MKFLFLICFLVQHGAIIVVGSKIDVTGYYWRDYEGEIPLDAIPGGYNENNETIYIGQTIYSKVGVIVPGKIDPKEKKLYFEFDNLEHPRTTDVKILCTAHPEQFKWVATSHNEKVSKVLKSNQRLIIGGHDRPVPVTIGRKGTGNEMQVGKVLIMNEAFYNLRVTKDGKGSGENSFEVLVYDPSVTGDTSSEVEGSDCVHRTININIS